MSRCTETTFQLINALFLDQMYYAMTFNDALIYTNNLKNIF